MTNNSSSLRQSLSPWRLFKGSLNSEPRKYWRKFRNDHKLNKPIRGKKF